MSALTREQLEARKKGIGSSDALKIIEGGEAWYALWLEKTSRAEPKPILSEWEAALRHCTEPLNLNWYAGLVGRGITRRGETVICAEHPILACTLDGFDEGLRGPVDAKHVSQWTGHYSGETAIEWCRSHYAPQVYHQMICTASERGALSVIIETKEPKPDLFELDAFWALEYIERCKEFWSFVVADKEPPGAPPAAPPPIPLDKMRVVDMTGSNAWGSLAADWLANRKPAERFKAAEKELKALVEADVREASGFGVIAKRDKRGLSLKEI